MTRPSRLFSRLSRLLDRVGARFRKTRPGSVLILVIALLVLMALIGTAFISTARVDRYSATQNTYNTQVDMLIQGVLGQAEAPLIRKVQGSSGTFRQAVSATAQPPGVSSSAAAPDTSDQYNPWDSYITDTYLAARYPTLIKNQASAVSVPGWVGITAPPNGTPSFPSGQFDAPYAIDANKNVVVGLVTYTARTNMIPSAISITQADGSVRVYPAFSGVYPLQTSLTAVSPTTGAGAGAVTPLTVLAADTDGDGIADAGFVRIPNGQLEGTTYYGAVRVIDNLAALNASIAMEPFTTVAGAYPQTPQTTQFAVPGDFFPINIDLRGAVATNGDDLAVTPSGVPGVPAGGLNAYRFGTGPWATPVADYSDTKSIRPDFQFNTQYEAAWYQLGCRLDNPGYYATSTGAFLPYQAVPISEGMNLAYHGGLANINAPSPSPVLKTYLPNSVYSASVRVPPFSPAATRPWYNTLYNYNASMPLRPMLVVRNPVSSFVPSYFTFQPLGGSYGFGDWVQYTDPNTGHPPHPGYPRVLSASDEPTRGL